jgi:hypothetical protein
VNSIRVREILNQNNYTAVPDFVSEHVSEPWATFLIIYVDKFQFFYESS